ncbi:hypothetical protein K8W59_06530 [Nocardioides rotundus]|uniref:hypothetical protein n=1 Tax=Nocardioides rotundus TaxID=1774216 RepID=UPI001CBB2C82|nr:hypothetical protein [Nocardioides rotundus]UAL31122.1 hypothetical protein K8W59_06530 [Nocardioides rotundus]
MTVAYEVRFETDAVHGSSTRRLPFEPKGWLRSYRDCLRSTLSQLRLYEDVGLRAVYSTPTHELADLENVLFYNLGSSSYRHLTHHGVEAFRTSSSDERHHVSYQLTSRSEMGMQQGEPLAEVTLDALPTPRDKAGAWWAAIRDRVQPTGAQATAEFTVEIVSHGQVTALVSAMKPMFDGLISALHSHDGSHREQISRELGRFGDAEQLWARLNDGSFAVLGPPRPLIRPHREGIAWNPADELCSAFSILPAASGPVLKATVRSAVAHSLGSGSVAGSR